MRKVRFRDESGNVRNGIWDNGMIEFGGGVYSPDNVDILAPSDATKVVCVGLNYEDHADEGNHEIPEIPRMFVKPPNTLAGHRKPITVPPGKEQIEPEVELGVVISKQCRNVTASNAMNVVEGFTCFNDLSNRDDQLAVERTGRPDMVRGKAFDNAAPVGPVIATPDEVPKDAEIELRVNGDLRQHTSRDKQIFSVPELIESITAYLTLEPGDIISTGTPAGPRPVAHEDTVEIKIEGIGTLENTILFPDPE